jgi:hypothetical protein
VEETPKKYSKPAYTINDPSGDPRLGGKIMWKMI